MPVRALVVGSTKAVNTVCSGRCPAVAAGGGASSHSMEGAFEYLPTPRMGDPSEELSPWFPVGRLTIAGVQGQGGTIHGNAT
jgi:hypothetical protein